MVEKLLDNCHPLTSSWPPKVFYVSAVVPVSSPIILTGRHMIIESSSLKFESEHLKEQYHEIRESLLVRQINQPIPIDSRSSENQPSIERVNISDAGRTRQSKQADELNDIIEKANNDPKLRMLMSIIAMLTGKPAKVFDVKELAADFRQAGFDIPAPKADSTGAVSPSQTARNPVENFSAIYEYHESYSEKEVTRFNASGVVQTADGQQINFDLSLMMSRSYYEESNLSIRLGDDRQTVDPLVINFNGNAAELTSQRFKFDLDTDGQEDEINFATGSSGFLVFDKNADGTINDGNEMFGAKTGDGFAELAAYDLDQNNWIDENDAIYQQLKIWAKDEAGNDRFYSLKEANIGAINLNSISTLFDIKDAQNQLQGQIKSSGIYLYENGGIGTVQQVDLTV